MALVQRQGAVRTYIVLLTRVTLVYLLAQGKNSVYDTLGKVGARQAGADAKALTLQS